MTAFAAACFAPIVGCSLYKPGLLVYDDGGADNTTSGGDDCFIPGDDGGGGMDGTIPPGDDATPPEAGHDASRETGADASQCPGTAGPTSLRIGNAGVYFCVDSTEVTNAQYGQFLAAMVPTNKQPAVCSWNTSYTPNGWPYAPGHDNYPVVYVNWCDAVAYCTWAGKRLCGGVGGGPNDPGNWQNPGTSQWLYACSHGGDGQHTWSYGNTYIAGACNDVGLDAGTTTPVASRLGCQGGFPGFYDMSGNAWELEDSCYIGDAGSNQDYCISRAGAFDAMRDQTQCTFAFTVPRSFTANDTSFRCCSNP